MKCIYIVLNQLKCYEGFNHKIKLHQRAPWSIIQSLAL